MWKLFLLSVCAAGLTPSTGPGGTVRIDEDLCCSVGGTQQTSKGECVISCSDSEIVTVLVGPRTAFYRCKPQLEISSFTPSYLFHAVVANLTMQVQGLHPDFSKDLACKIGPVTVKAYLTTRGVSCEYVSLAPGSYTFSVSDNLYDFADYQTIEYRTTPRLTKAAPLSGYSPWTVSIEGVELVSSMQCLFDGVSVDATVSSSSLTCEAPSSVSGSVALSVTAEDIELGKYSLTVLEKWRVTAVYPSLLFDDSIQVLGQGFDPRVSVLCKVGSLTYSATVKSADSLTCELSGLTAGTYAVDLVTSDGVTISNSQQSFEKVTGTVSFAASKTSSLDTALTISASFSFNDSSLYCMVGSYGPYKVTKATDYVCPSSQVNDIGTFCIELSFNNAASFSSDCAQTVTLYRPSRFKSVTPAIFLEGETGLIVATSAKLTSGAEYSCKLSTTALSVSVSDNEVSCEVPSSTSAGSYTLSIYQDNHYTLTEFSFSVKAPAQLTSFSPSVVMVPGSTITITGSNLPVQQRDGSAVSCVFEVGSTTYTVTPTELSSTQAVCATPDVSSSLSSDASSVEFTVKLSQLEGSWSNTLTITAYRSPSITDVVPSVVFEGTYNYLVVTVQDLVQTSALTLRGLCGSSTSFNASATYLYQSQLKAVYFSAECNPFTVSSVSLQLSLNGQDFSSGFSVSLYRSPSLGYVSPYRRHTVGNFALNIFGSGFSSSLRLWCVLQNTEFAASVVSSSHLTCTVPFMSQGTKVVSVRADKAYFADKAQVFTSLASFSYSVSQHRGPTSGGTLLELTGDFSELTSTDTLKCKFGSTSFDATLVSSTKISCTTPAYSGGNQELKLIVNDFDTSVYSSNKSFLFEVYPSITSAHPSSFPSADSTLLTLSGSDFSSSEGWRCVWPSSESSLFALSSDKGMCSSPAISPQTLSLTVSSNSQNSSVSLSLTVYKDPSIYSISPTKGPRTGDTEVTLIGRYLDNATHCSFGGVKVTASDVSTNSLKCRAPAGSGQVEVEVSLNSNNYTTSGLTFTYYEYFTISAVDPPLGPVSGGTLLTITGSNFLDETECVIDGTRVTAEYISSSEIKCQVPSMSASGRKYLSLSANQQQAHTFDLTGSFLAYAAFSDVSISSPYVTNGTPVVVKASNLIDNHKFSCKVGDTSADWMFNDEGTVTCVMPQLQKDTYQLRLSNNGVDYEDVGQLNYYDEVQVSYVDTTFQLLSGDYSVTIKAFNIQDSAQLACKFLLISPLLIRLGTVQAEYLSPSTLRCTSPASTIPGIAAIQVSNDNEVWSGSGDASFELVQTCRPGFYCEDGQLVICPSGSQCDGLRWYSTAPCEAGEYQKDEGQSFCTQCPPGTYCPSQGLDTPQSCPANTICPYYGLSVPYDDCPRGFVCPSKTATVSPTVESAKASRGALCEAGSYCREGSDAAKCSEEFYCSGGSTHYYGEVICPLGHYCKDNVILQCPAKTYCDERGETLPKKCPPGTYSTLAGLTQCEPCPFGSICQTEGLSTPESCPASYVCSKQGLKAAETKCFAGYYCEGGVETSFIKRPCREISDSDTNDLSFCGDQTMYLKDDPDNVSENISQFSRKVNLCCWSVQTTADFIESLGNNTSSQKAFTRAAENSKKAGYTGIDLYSLRLTSTTQRRMQQTTQINDSLGLHLPSDKENLDLWLGQLTDSTMAEICPAGVFCLQGVASSVAGEDITTPYVCNAGTYCQPGASTPAGTALCPKGYYCHKGASEPTPTEQGYAAPVLGSVEQSVCPLGSFTGALSSESCSSCPDGYQCSQAGLQWPLICEPGTYRSSSTSSLCTNCPMFTWSPDYSLISSAECLGCKAGRICNTQGILNITVSLPCTEGNYCNYPEGQQDEPCPAGFVCSAGLSPEQKYNKACESGFYCPERTAERNQFLLPCPDFAYCPDATPSYDMFDNSSDSSASIPPTICPEGTGRNSISGLKSLLDCTPTETYNNTSRRLTTSYSGFYVSVSPLNLSLINATETTLEENSTILATREIVFTLEPRNLALVTIDLRHWSNASNHIVYQRDWEISFTVKSSMDPNDDSEPIVLPDTFLNVNVSKSAVHEFELMAWDTLSFRVNILIYNGLIAAQYEQFLNSTSVEVFTANRADFGTTKTFLTLINSDTALPVNLPRPTVEGVPRFLLTYSGETQIKNELIDNDNRFLPNSLYWQDMTQQYLPYLPYFSNCKGYGKFIPFWAVFETGSGCDLVAHDSTKPVEEFGFGSVPKADECKSVSFSCIYDETPDDNQQVPRWWEQPLGTSVFFITKQPVSDDDFVNDPGTLELIPVNTFQETSSGSLPSIVHLEVLYYQFDTERKRIVEANLYFEEFVSLTSEQLRGDEITPYTLKLTFRPLTHRELMVRFEFSLGFYTTLNLIVGFVSLAMTAIFVFYHRVLSKVTPKPKFKFWGYLLMMTPAPLKGMMLAVAPVFLVLVLISVLILGELFQADTTVNGKAMMFEDSEADYTNKQGVSILAARYGRCGVSFLVIGLYVFACAICIFVPKNERLIYDEDPSGNIWKKPTWRRSFTFFIALMFVMFFVFLIQFSFSSVFGDNIWSVLSRVFIASLKVVFEVCEYIVEKSFGNMLLLSPFMQSIGVMEGLITFGASDFVNFLEAYFVEYSEV
jgi:hypothetical protein